MERVTQPAYKRIDYVLVHENTEDLSKKLLRERFEDALKKSGFFIETLKFGVKRQIMKLHCSFKRLCEEAERVGLEMPLEGCENDQSSLKQNCFRKVIDEYFNTEEKSDETCAPFEVDKIKMFKNNENPEKFFRPSVRSLLTAHILDNMDKEDGGLPYLRSKKVYEDAFILHEDTEIFPKRDTKNDEATSEETKPETTENPLKDLEDTWLRCKFQPLGKIRNYFGEKIGLYFAWAGLLLISLWVPAILGLGCFIYGLIVGIVQSNLADEMPVNLTATEEFTWQLKQLYETVRGAFDNHATPVYAIIICLWGTLFLELWKRQNAKLAYEWNVDNYEANEPDRPEFTETKDTKDKECSQVIKFIASASASVLMVCCVGISVAAVVVYRVTINVTSCKNMTSTQCFIHTTVVSAVLNAFSILVLGMIYERLANLLTVWENHSTQTEHDNAYIIKLFVFQFANNYASCFYIAFFRGRFDSSGVFGLGEEYKDICDGGSCMSHLSFQVLVLMILKPIPKFLKDNIWLSSIKPKINRLGRYRRTGVILDKHAKFILDELDKTDIGDFTIEEYNEKVILYGFLMLFAASFPLAPLLALLWLAFDIRGDAKRLLKLHRRPVAKISQKIGMWYKMLNFVNLVAVVSNGFLIAFTSQFGLKYELATRLWICLGFEHGVLTLKFLMAYFIRDVPKNVQRAKKRKKHEIAKKMKEGRRKTNEIRDYLDNVPLSDLESDKTPV